MHRLSFLISTLAAAVCVVLSAWLFAASSSNRGLQSELQKLKEEAQGKQETLQTKQQQLQAQQEQINAGNTISQQVGPALLRDMAVASNTNESMKKLLEKHGYDVKPAASPAPDQKTSAQP